MTGSSLGFPAVWLRHNCPCATCLDPVTGQRLIEVTAIPNGCRVTVEAQTAESVTVVFAPDGHRAVFRRAWLADQALPAGRAADQRTENGKRLWRAADLEALPAADWDSYLADDAVRAACLDAVATLGFALLPGTAQQSLGHRPQQPRLEHEALQFALGVAHCIGVHEVRIDRADQRTINIRSGVATAR